MHYPKRSTRILQVLALGLSISLFVQPLAYAADYAFPVIGPSSFTNDFDAPRSNGPHHATDIIADKRQKIVSRTNGVITFVGYPQPSWGFSVFVEADNGYTYWYIHINNDTPGTDDGRADAYYAYGPDVQEGNRVSEGQLLGYVGDSGNAETTVPHLHFEILKPNNERVNPYYGLVNNSYRLSSPRLTYPQVGNEILPSSRTFTGGYTLAFGDVDGNDVDELIVGPGKGGKQVKVLAQDGTLISAFEPNGSTFLGGVDVAAGDIDGDGNDEIITGAGPGGKQVKVFEADGTPISIFHPYGTTFSGGIDVASGDIDGDNVEDIITGTGPGGKQVAVFSAAGGIKSRIDLPYGSAIGVSVAVGNFDLDAQEEIVTGARKGGGPRVIVYNANGTQVSSRYAYTSDFKGGVRVEAANIDGSTAQDEILTVSQTGGSPRVKIISNQNGQYDWTEYFAEVWWNGYYDIAVSSENDIFTSMGTNRRSTVRPVEQ